MKKQIAGAALKYAGREMAKGFRKKASKALDKAARAVRPNPANDPDRVKVGDLLQFKDENGAGRIVWTRPVEVVEIEDARERRPRGWLGAKVRFPLKPGARRATTAWISLIPSPGSAGTEWRFARKQTRPNPYDQKGATFDLFGGESRALPKKVSEFHRPRVRVRGGTMTLAEGSPFKGRVVKLNPAPRIVLQPLRVTLTAAEVKAYKAAPDTFLSSLLKKAATVSQAWDHIEARGPGGRHLFDVIP